MAPQPRKQNPQRQPLTVALRKICRDYPAGAGVLKELLQNADDAGASTVKFILDTKTHQKSPLLVDELSEYQGPALLAYNDALFTEKDFQSLTSLGDSKKVQDKAATGKFGLGFSSVFNWTDCPSVLSGSTLLFLDPHHSWSRGFDPPGGPDYDFPAFAKDEAMINHLECFSQLNTDWERDFHGTIIRLPLRNTSQAERSEISKTETTENDVRIAIDAFANEMGSNGLLFLKSVRRIVLSINDEQLDDVEIVNQHELTEPKERLRSLLSTCMNYKDQAGGEVYHEVHLRHKVAERETLKTFGILNLVAGTVQNGPLQDWAASEKLFPWVAIAAPLKGFDGSSEMGRLFTTLPLPCSTGLPVHIHGLFSISADRSRVHGLDDSGVQDHRPKEWNKVLFNRLIPIAWAKLLLKICQTYPTQEHSTLWPMEKPSPGHLWDGMCRAIMDQVFQNQMRVWYTDLGYIALEDGLLAPEETPWEARTTFNEARIPIIYMATHLVDEARQLAGSRTLSPRTLYESLQGMKNVDKLSSSSKLVVLEYLIGEIPLADLGTLEIFPFHDGNFRSLKLEAVFLHRNDLEKTLFARQEESTIDTNKLSETASRSMHERVKQSNRMVRYRNAEDLHDYYIKHIANGSGDIIFLDEDLRSTLSHVWTWLIKNFRNKLPLGVLGPLWLVPLRDSQLRKLVPQDTSNFATWFHPGEVNDIALRMAASKPEDAPKVLAADLFSEDVSPWFLAFADKEQSLCTNDGNKFESFLNFLVQGRSLLQTAGEDIKSSVLRALKQLWWSGGRPRTNRVCNLLKSLHLFKAVYWHNDASESPLRREWINMTSQVAFIGLSKLVPVPVVPRRVFVDVTDQTDLVLFQALGLFKCLDEVNIIEKIVIPAMVSGEYDHMRPNFRLEAVGSVFQNYYHISNIARAYLPSLAVVPLKERGESSLSFACASDVLDPQQPALRKLYFEDEIALPDQNFYNRFSAILAECGMVKCLNDRFVLARIRSYGKKDREFGVVASRAKNLLQLPFQKTNAQPDDVTKAAREIKWLPAQSPEKHDALTNSSKCRDISDKPYVGRAWNILPFQIHKSWRPILGWQSGITVDVLVDQQLVRSIAASDIQSVQQTLSYLCKHHSTENFIDRLLKLSFVRTSNSELVETGKVCRRDSERLMPYLHTVDPRFWNDHCKIMKLASIPQLPSLEQLRDVQKALESRDGLNEEDLDVAVELARIWGVRFPDSTHGLKLPSNSHILVEVVDLVFNDAPWLPEPKRAVVHPKISRITAEQLKIEPLSELLKNGDLGIVDPDEDLFFQRQEVADGIRDTLDRYAIESTFHEFLANADDCGSASEANFLLDRTTYDTRHLLTQDLQVLQGPSLLVHNDGIFTNADFEGLKRVGRGSKRDDPTVIGKFGRGSQTMFHWSDCPMILSGDHLLILDPLQKYLPFSYRIRQKKPGVLVKYANLKATCQDQLAPFEGLWGFDSDQDFYNGTIFRFPLRREGQDSELLESRLSPDISTSAELFRKCFDEARLALLFLRNITTIDFNIRHDVDLKWRVRRGTWPESGTFSDWAHVLIEQRNPLGEITSTAERWWRVIVDVQDAPADLQHRHKRRMKDVECGIAALVPQKEAKRSVLQPLKSRFFNCLPLKFESTLPVHIHATFLLSGDRQNIATEETSQDAGAEWNRWLLEKKLPLVYLQFLEDIGRKISQDVYNYFPSGISGRQDLLSDLIRTSFWREIKSSNFRLFPVIEASKDPMLPRPTPRGNRAAPHLITFERAVFDVLEKKESDALRPLLCNCLDDLVRPPYRLAVHIKQVAGVKVLDPALLRSVLKSIEARTHIEKAHQMHKDFLSNLLSFIMPKTPGEVMELDDCPVLPLENGRLGTLSLKSSEARIGSVTTYFAANSECRSLFALASSLLCADGGHPMFVEKILGSDLFNLKTLEKGDVCVLLNSQSPWPREWQSEAWILRFWNYINLASSHWREPTSPKIPDLDSLKHYPLLFLRCQDGKESLVSLDYFESEPVTVSSAVEEHMNLLADFPGLGIVDSRTVPQSICQNERSLSDLASINRFLKSIGLLATREGRSLTEFVRVSVKGRNIETLRNIILEISGRVKSDTMPLSDSVRDLPVWTRLSSKKGYLTAREAIVARHNTFVVPWIKEYHRFTNFNSFHQDLAIDDIRMVNQYVLSALPERLDKENKPPYIRLINSLASSSSLKMTTSINTRRFVMPLNPHRLAARQDGILCLASDLFDHSDTIFVAAFRASGTDKFLMSEVRFYLSFWYEVGIRHRENGIFNKGDYLACLRALKARLATDTGQPLAADTEVVLRPLCTNDGSLKRLDSMAWTTIASLPIFPVNPTLENQHEYRRLRTEVLASQTYNLCLKDIVRREFAPVSWSQILFTPYEPSVFSLEHAGTTGRPNCAMVWQHLRVLAQLAPSVNEVDVERFSEDLQRTYGYLQLHLQESKSTFSDINAPVWLNADATSPGAVSLDVVRSSWISLENLLLDSPCDAPPLMTVRPFLGRFSTLLKGIGCESVHYPQVAPPASTEPQTTLALVRDLWEKDILTDVMFEAEGRSISAHKIILASRSLYCKLQFDGPWAAASGNNESTKVIKLEDMTFATLKILVRFCYNEDQDWATEMRVKDDDTLEVIADKLDVLLDVLVAADRWLMPNLHADAERSVITGTRFFIRPDNVKHVQKIVNEANSIALGNYCHEYMEQNAGAVLLANG